MSRDLKNWEQFAKQSEFFWRFQQTVALVEIGLFSGWYTLFRDKQLTLSIALLSVGILVLTILFLIIYRASQYLNTLRKIVKEEIPDLPKPLLNIPSSMIGNAIPIILIFFNIALLIFSLSKL